MTSHPARPSAGCCGSLQPDTHCHVNLCRQSCPRTASATSYDPSITLREVGERDIKTGCSPGQQSCSLWRRVPAIVGFPSIFGDMRQFAEALGMPSAEWQWWNYLMVGGGLFGMALGAQRMWAHWNKPRKKAHSVDAGPITHHWHVPQPTVTVKRASLFRRVRQSLGKGPKRGQGELGRVTAAGTPGSGRALPTCRSNYFNALVQNNELLPRVGDGLREGDGVSWEVMKPPPPGLQAISDTP